MEPSHQASKIMERLLLVLLVLLLGSAAWEQYASGRLRRLSALEDKPVEWMIRTRPAMHITYTPSEKTVYVTVQSFPACRAKAACPPEETVSLPYFTPREIHQGPFWEAFKKTLSSWRYNPLLLGGVVQAYVSARWQGRTNISVGEFLLVGLELSRLKTNDFIVKLPSRVSAKSTPRRREVPLESSPLDKAPLTLQDRPIVAEVLNASGRKGLALELTQYLREQNTRGLLRVDVLQYDNYPTIQETSWLEDYAGRTLQLKQLGSALGIHGEIRAGNTPNVICDTRIILGKDFKMPL